MDEISERYTLFTSTISGLMYCIQTLKQIALSEFQLRGGNVNCLFYLNQHPEGQTLTQLAALCSEDKSIVSKNIAELVDRGLVSSDACGGKKYRARLQLTQEGQKVADRLCQVVANSVEAGGKLLDEESRKGFYQSLLSIYQSLTAYITDVKGQEG